MHAHFHADARTCRHAKKAHLPQCKSNYESRAFRILHCGNTTSTCRVVFWCVCISCFLLAARRLKLEASHPELLKFPLSNDKNIKYQIKILKKKQTNKQTSNVSQPNDRNRHKTARSFAKNIRLTVPTCEQKQTRLSAFGSPYNENKTYHQMG